MSLPDMYSSVMDVSVSELRAHLARYLKAAQEGAEVIVTDRGAPVARLGPANERNLIEELVRDGVLTRPSRPKFSASRRRPVHAQGSVSDILAAQREAARG